MTLYNFLGETLPRTSQNGSLFELFQHCSFLIIFHEIMHFSCFSILTAENVLKTPYHDDDSERLNEWKRRMIIAVNFPI